MDPVAQFVKHCSFPVIAWRQGFKGIYRHVHALEESQYWPRERLHDLQMELLKRILVHAYENTKFYRIRFDDCGFNPYNDISENDLDGIPFLTKDQIRDHLEELTAGNFHPEELHSSETGGTTGVKMRFYRDNACLAPKEAALYRFEKWTGWDFGESTGIVWPAQQDYVGHWTWKARLKNSLSTRHVVLPGAIIDRQMLSGYVKVLMKKKPAMIRAFPSPLHEVAEFIVSEGIDGIRLKGVITTGEPLYAYQREAITRAFHCPVFDAYRTREAGPIAQECEYHDGMHTNAESLYIEVADGQIIGDGKDITGEVVVTDLLNFGMPLIRYRMGDFATFSDVPCPCGRGLPIIKRVEGRAGDIFYTPDRKKIPTSALVLYLIDEAPGLIGQIQVIQDRCDHVLIMMTRAPEPTKEIMEYQVQTVKRLFGQDMQVSFSFVDTIPREKSGKYIFAKCLLNEKDLPGR